MIKHSPAARRRGFTVMEMMLVVSLSSLLLLGATQLFLASSQAAMRTSVAGQSTLDAANGLQFVMGNTREALTCTLPSDPTNFAAPVGTVANYQCQPPSGPLLNTGVKLVFPGTPAATVKLVDGSGGTFTPSQPYDKSTNGGTLWVYRANTDGTPNAAAGSCLWALLRRAGLPDSSRPVARMILTSGASTPYAVQFSQPRTGQLQVKIVSGAFSAIGAGYGTVTNEATDGTSVTQLTGECVLMRNASTGY